MICPTCRADTAEPCRRPNRDRRLPHARRLIAAAASSLLQQLWRTLPGKEQVRLLSQLSIDGGRHPGPAGLYSLPVTDPGPEWFRALDQWHAALDLVERAQNLLNLAHSLYGQGSIRDQSRQRPRQSS
jgi:hypothetical protein